MKNEVKEKSVLAENNNCSGPRRSLRNCSKGLSTVEYVILMVLIAVGAIGFWQSFGDEIDDRITKSTEDVKGMQ